MPHSQEKRASLTIACAQVNPTVGDIAGNTSIVRRVRDQAAAQHADLVVFPELVLVGYPPEDLVLRPALVEAAARASVDDTVSKPKGKLRIAAPAGLGRRYVAPALCAFLRDYPEIEAQLDLQDRPVNLQEDGYDVAIRTGSLTDSSVIAKRLAPDRQAVPPTERLLLLARQRLPAPLLAQRAARAQPEVEVVEDLGRILLGVAGSVVRHDASLVPVSAVPTPEYSPAT